jgi:hypothetical protein
MFVANRMLTGQMVITIRRELAAARRAVPVRDSMSRGRDDMLRRKLTSN